MIVRELGPVQKRRWKGWAAKALGLKCNPDADPHRLEVPYSIIACRVSRLKGKLLLNRETDEPIYLLRFGDGTSACHFHGHVRRPRAGSRREREKLEKEIHDAAKEGRLWWGTEKLSDPPWHTTILYVAPPGGGR